MAFSLSDYSDFREIGRGGMGKVYLATQRSLGRNVVIKEMMTGLVADATQVKRFENEARSAAALNHPNVIRVYDFGPDRDSFYIVMEYVDGPDLEQLLARQDIPREVCLMVMLQALKGLDYAHERGIIHRDVKPGNVLASMSGEAKIMDFGLAHAGSQAVHLTASEAIVGTPQYMAPEQANGVEEKTVRMDVFSAGVLAYRVVTGRLPFAGNSIPALLFSITQTPEPQLSEIAPWVDEELATAIHAALVKDPSGRSESLDSLISAIQKYLFALGIADPVACVHRCLTNPQAGAYDVYQRMIAHHLKRARELLAAGDAARAKAHVEQTLRIDPHHADAAQIAHEIAGGTTLVKLMRDRTPSPGATLVTKRREQRAPIVAISIVAAVFAIVGIGSWVALRLTRPTPVVAVPAADTVKVAPVAVPVAPVVDSATAANPQSVQADTATRAGTTSAQSSGTPQASGAPAKGTVELHVEPTRATVLVDGKKVSGKGGDYTLRLPVGKHTVKVVADGFEQYARAITVKRGANQSYDIVLPAVQVSSGTLHIHTYPWAELFVDGRYVGNTPTSAPLVLSPGKHSIVLSRAGYEQKEFMVEVKPGQHLAQNYKLAPLTQTNVPQ